MHFCGVVQSSQDVLHKSGRLWTQVGVAACLWLGKVYLMSRLMGVNIFYTLKWVCMDSVCVSAVWQLFTAECILHADGVMNNGGKEKCAQGLN